MLGTKKRIFISSGEETGLKVFDNPPPFRYFCSICTSCSSPMVFRPFFC